MTVEAFLANADHYLHRCDVLLFKGKRSLPSRLIRWSTESHFSHAALLFLLPHRDKGFDSTFLLESTSGGVDLTDLREYLVDRSHKYDVAIKRLEADWFDADVRKEVRGHMLNFIKAKYDFGTIGKLAAATLRRVLFGVQRRFRRDLEDALRKTKDEFVPGRFICSGFVQYGFCATVQRLEEAEELPSGTLRQVAFKRGVSSVADDAAILSTTPQDLAMSEKLTWKYVIREGLVYAVSRAEQVERLLARTADRDALLELQQASAQEAPPIDTRLLN